MTDLKGKNIIITYSGGEEPFEISLNENVLQFTNMGLTTPKICDGKIVLEKGNDADIVLIVVIIIVVLVICCAAYIFIVMRRTREYKDEGNPTSNPAVATKAAGGGGGLFGGAFFGAPPSADAALATSPALRVCVAGEGEPPLELLLAAVACAASGEVLGVPVQQLREGDLVELDLSGRGVSVGGVRLLALLLPSCSKLVRLK